MSPLRPRAYVAGKYSAPTEEERLANTRRAMEVGLALWAKGYAPFIPHLSHFTDNLAAELGGRLSYTDWLEWDNAFQDTCAIFFYDSSSSGADREYHNAQALGQPVFRHLDDVPLAKDLTRYLNGVYDTVASVLSGSQWRQEVLVERLPHAVDLPLPEYQTAGAAGLDLCAAIPSDSPMALMPGERFMVPTGLKIALPQGMAGLVLPRSGLATKDGVTLANTPGLVDSDFRGELMIALLNSGPNVFNFYRGHRLAQFVLIDYSTVRWSEVRTLPDTARGEAGFGSTGVQQRTQANN